jgi:uncharacterized protein (DUF488 family)
MGEPSFDIHPDTDVRVFTIGHSTRTLEEFLALLSSHHISLLIDIRIAPASRRFPHFNREPLSAALAASGIRYLHLQDLGGRRAPRADSPHTGWRSRGFRGYADYMDTFQWTEAVARVLSHAQTETVALMCAEAVPWRCHRNLVADGLMVRGATVLHIIGSDPPARHKLTSFARVEGTRIIYDGAPSSQQLALSTPPKD